MGVGCSHPHPTRRIPASFLGSLSTLLCCQLSLAGSLPLPLFCFILCIEPPSSKVHPELQPETPTNQPHQPCLRRPRWVEAECSHSDWQAGALGESPHHTRTGSRKCIPCPGKGSPAGSGAGSLGLGRESRGCWAQMWTLLLCLHVPHPKIPRPAW